MAKVEIMSPVDAAWLSMEESTNLMMVNAIITFDHPLDIDRVRQVLRYRWLRHHRFRQRVVRPSVPFLRPYWEDDPHFDLDLHLQRVALPPPGDRAALQEMISDLMSGPLDFARPPWKFIIIENYGQGCAVMARIHHCLADGMALVAVLLAMTDFYPDAPLTPVEPASDDHLADSWRGGLVRDLSGGIGVARAAVGGLLRHARSRDAAVELGEQGAGMGLAAGRLLARSPDPPTRLKGPLGVLKRAAWADPIPLADVKRIKDTFGGTVNDVLVAAVTAGLRRYLVAKGDNVGDDGGGLEIRAVIPVNLRREDDNGKLGNRFGLVFLTLPIHVEQPLMRLAEVRRRMLELKRSAEAPVTLGILGAMGLGTDAFREFVVRMLEPKATLVLTNVPGPPVPLYLAGQRIRDLMFWVPQAGRLGMGISILSYAGNIHLGIVTDAGLVPCPAEVLAGVVAEVEQLKEQALTVAAADR